MQSSVRDCAGKFHLPTIQTAVLVQFHNGAYPNLLVRALHDLNCEPYELALLGSFTIEGRKVKHGNYWLELVLQHEGFALSFCSRSISTEHKIMI